MGEGAQNVPRRNGIAHNAQNRRIAGLALILCQPFLLSAQNASAQNAPITPLGASQQQETQKPAQITPPAGSAAPVDSSTYKVGPGDILNIDVWHEPQFTGVYTVHSDGKITLKLVGEDLQSQGRAYMDPTLVLADGLADDVARFIHEASGGTSKAKK